MLALLSCSTPPIDDFDPYAAPPAPPALPRFRRASRSLSFIKPPSRRKVSKMSIGAPENFRHEFHLGMDIIASDAVSLWDATRFLDELRAQQGTATASTPSIAPSTPSVAPSTPPPSTRAQKRNSITPQKRKPVPSLIPDIPHPPPRAPADVPLPLSPIDTLPPSPTDVPLPPSPTAESAEQRPWDAHESTTDHA